MNTVNKSYLSFKVKETTNTKTNKKGYVYSMYPNFPSNIKKKPLVSFYLDKIGVDMFENYAHAFMGKNKYGEQVLKCSAVESYRDKGMTWFVAIPFNGRISSVSITGPGVCPAKILSQVIVSTPKDTTGDKNFKRKYIPGTKATKMLFIVCNSTHVNDKIFIHTYSASKIKGDNDNCTVRRSYLECPLVCVEPVIGNVDINFVDEPTVVSTETMTWDEYKNLSEQKF